jgi:dihydropyrimidine dehydrogenase (NAD+) subunit PreT
VIGAVEWIERMKMEPGARIAGVRRAVVIGGGNTAIDAARELAGLGVPVVSMLYRRTTSEMSGYAHELDQARRSGVVLVERAVPARFERDGQGALTGVTLQGGEMHACELAIVAIGQARIADLARGFPGVERDARGSLVADPQTGATGHPRVFAGGDAMHGGELIVTAVQDGKRAARGICAALGVPIRSDSPMWAGHE